MRKRAEEKIRDAEDEVVNVLEHKPQEPWLENIYRPVGNTVTVQQPVADDEPMPQPDQPYVLISPTFADSLSPDSGSCSNRMPSATGA